MSTNEIPTREQMLAEAQRQWNYTAQEGHQEDTLLHIKYIARVCACAMRCEEMSDEDRDAVYLLLSQSSILCDVLMHSK